jgi:hypothetical protein
MVYNGDLPQTSRPTLMRHVVGKSVASTIGWGVSMSPFAISGFVVARGVYRLVSKAVALTCTRKPTFAIKGKQTMFF